MIFLLTNNTFSLVLKWSLRVFVVAQSITATYSRMLKEFYFIVTYFSSVLCMFVTKWKTKYHLSCHRKFSTIQQRGGSTAIWSSLHQNVLLRIYVHILEKSYSSTDMLKHWWNGNRGGIIASSYYLCLYLLPENKWL